LPSKKKITRCVRRRAANNCTFNSCCTTSYFNGKQTSRLCTERNRFCPTTLRTECSNHRQKNGSIQRRCCLNRIRDGVVIGKQCYLKSTIYRLKVKTSCGVKKTKHCKLRKCCQYKFNYKSNQWKERKYTCKLSKKCKNTKRKCRYLREKDGCRKLRCCTRRHGHKRTCKSYNRECPIKRSVKCWWRSKELCKERHCCVSRSRGKKVLSNKCKLTRKFCPTTTKRHCKTLRLKK